ncbi:TetR/AcrR family transcriptional regulator [Paenibacillus terreus]|uniref:TetR/AcrR family transcriptional regulator n=1 Tax=Paenibacillus terreus TaxID=1387834 RepID=A0ABV5BEB3_9BACL
MANKSKKEHILKVASDLFNKQGIRATGVDQVVSESNVAKMTLYNHFQSKDDLVLAYLMRQDDEWRTWFEESVNKQGKNPKDKLLAVFDVLGEWFEEPEFNGCAFIKTASEFTDHSHPYYEAAHHYKLFLRHYIASLIDQCNVSDPEALANGLFLLVEGAITTAMLQTDPKPALHAQESARIIIDHFIKSD